MIEILLVVSLVLLALLVHRGLGAYCHPSISGFQRVFLFTTLFVALSNFPLIFVDVYKQLFSPELVDLKPIWRISFWTTFVNSWLVLPLIRNFLNSKLSTPRSRFCQGLRRQMGMWLIQGGLATSLLFYLYKSYGNFRFFAVLVALNNSFGFLIIMTSLGYSLVSLPRTLKGRVLGPERVERLRAHIHSMTSLHTELLIPIELEYKKAFYFVKKEAETTEEARRVISERMLPEVISSLPPLETETDPEELKKGPSPDALDNLNLRFLLSSRKLHEMKSEVTYYEMYKNTLKFKIWNFVLSNLHINSIVFGTVVFALEVLIPFEQQFGFNLFNLVAKKTSLFFAFTNILQFIAYLIFCVIYANVKVRLGASFSLEKKLTSISAAVFFITFP